MVVALGQQPGQVVGGVEVVGHVRRAVALGRGVDAEEEGVGPFDHVGNVGREEQIAIEVLGHDVGQAGFVHVAFDGLGLAGLIGGDARCVDVVGVDFVAVLRKDGRVR